MELAIQKLAALSLFIISLSHVVRPRAWAEYFIWLRGKGSSGVFLDAFLYLYLGGLIVAFHNVWTGLPAVLTVLGWGCVLKSLIRFTWPEVGLRMMQRVSLDRAYEFQIAGAFMLGLSGLMAWSAFGR
jgi:hypothetical protein